mmetsp:Transcript_21499/g.20649  ORF Transcript_21499/g.20649 Transcript_21499/m.20649 type:complete len:232 (-) Transcript_21499:319-1014(-)|eukprot:CAMPEP_0197823774 /NCGR_PEP_ID=MMETSP1437-20131217/1077_1 /TAXON_ID=49252 ORGANISM="Eucampia antarctica, Strain CCMP1452" /NCGR_SAMPLE_ID=MMETSP1437 /ASSEMBLY_ACC=CAM_ASM_001096 /LENGTH=231 /DNA_ID=CAMNT_0043423093 /DNA_START=62 /DNA_END=757 /DNA_ORIENTATION=+
MIRFYVAVVSFLTILSINNAFLLVSPSRQANLPYQTERISSFTAKAASKHPIYDEKGNAQDNNSDSLTASSVASIAALIIAISVPILPALAVSGGGLDYANLDITGQDFSNGKYKGKDFTQVIAKGTNFAKSNLQGCRFYKAYLVNADFSGADLRGAALEDTSMTGASLKGANASGAYFGDSILEVESMENADFTDAQIQVKLLSRLCEREDVKGTNPSSGVDTRDSLMCP